MITPEAAEQLIRDLTFELNEIREPKFLICVCNDDDEATSLTSRLSAALEGEGKKALSVSARDFHGNLIELLVTSNKDGSADVIYLTNISALSKKDLDRF